MKLSPHPGFHPCPTRTLQQLKAISPPFSQSETQPTSAFSVAGCATGSARLLTGVHHYKVERLGLYPRLRSCSLAGSILMVAIAARVRQVAYICGYLRVTSMLQCGRLPRSKPGARGRGLSAKCTTSAAC